MKNETAKMIFIAWAPYSRRSQSFALKLDIPLYLIHYFKFQQPLYAPLKYLFQVLHTVILLLKERPQVVFIQDPPVFACLSVYVYSRIPFCSTRIIIDAHSGSFFHPVWKSFRKLQKFLFRRALTVITTNQTLTDLVQSWGADSIALAHPPITFPPGEAMTLSDKFNIVLVNSFSPDEPLSAALDAVSKKPDVHLYVTGDARKASPEVLKVKRENVTFTDFLNDEDYIALLRGADAVMVLTEKDYTLQLGAIEAVAAGKPIIISDLSFLRTQFHLGTLHVPNTLEGLKEGITRMQKEVAPLAREIIELRSDLDREWESQSRKLWEILQIQPVSGPLKNQ